MTLKKRFLTFKKDFMLPVPLLVGVELNPGPSLTNDQRQKILCLKQDAGLSNKDIARKLGINIKTVRRWVKRNLRHLPLKNLRGQGRKRKLSVKEEKRIAKKAKEKEVEAPQLAREVSEKLGETISDDTIQRALKRQGLKYLVKNKVQVITPQQAANRLAFAKKMMSYDWKFALFTDEKTFQLGATNRRSWQDPDDRKTVEYKRHAPKIHVWGGIGLHFKTKLYFFQKTLVAPLYCKILKARLPPQYKYDLHPHEHNKWILVQDNDPKHTAAQSQKLLDKLAPDRISDWPSNSPDFNPIEDAWSMMAHEIEHKNIKNITSLKSNLTKAWDNLGISKIRPSIESIPRRLEQCIKRKGKRTNY
jgi:transposase